MTETIEVTAFWRLPKVREMTSLQSSTVWTWVREGKFPKPIKLSPTITAWRASDVAAWMEAKFNGENPRYD